MFHVVQSNIKGSIVVFKIREYIDGSDLETLMKNPSLCPALRSPEERIKMAVGIAKVRIEIRMNRMSCNLILRV